MDLLERAKEHQTVDEANQILYEIMLAINDDEIDPKRADKVTNAVTKQKKELCEELEESGDLGKYYNPE